MLIENSLLLWTFAKFVDGVIPGIHNPHILLIPIGSDGQKGTVSYELLRAADAFEFFLWTVVGCVLEVGIFYSHYYNFAHGNKIG